MSRLPSTSGGNSFLSAFMMTRTFRLAAGILLLSLLSAASLGAPSPAYAHASLLRSDPSPRSVMVDPPERVTLWFAEPLEPKFSEIRVLDSAGNRIDNGDTAVSPSDPKSLSVGLGPQGQGSYTVAWRNVSALDGHALRDSFSYSVGTESAAGQPIGRESSSFPSPPAPALKWISLLAALALVGGSGFYLLVAAPALRRFEAVASGIARRARILQWVAIPVVVVSDLGRLVLQTSTVLEIPASQAFGLPALRVLTETAWGGLLAVRVALMALAAAIMAATAFSSRRGAATDTGWRPTLVIGMLALATFSLSSHGFALGGLQVEGTVTDYLHLVAATIWVGGLLHLLLGFPLLASLHPLDRQEALPALITRFSRVAGPSVGVLIITGLYSAWAMAGAVLPAYTQTPYGQALLAKMSVVAIALALAALNLFVISPRLGYGSAWRWLRRLVLGEVLLTGLALLAGGYMATLEPARPVAAREGLGQEMALLLHADAGDKHLRIRVEPGHVGENSVFVLVDDREYRPVNDADVSLRLTEEAADLQIEDLTTERSGDGEYSVEAVPLDVSGQWRLDIAVRRPGSFDAMTSVLFDLGSALPADPSYIPTNTGRQWFGLELLLLGLLFQVTGFRFGVWRSRAGFLVLWAAGAMAVSGLVYLAIGVLTGDGGATGM